MSGRGRRLVRAPMYQQLHGILRDLIRSGEFGLGDKFATEREVSARFGVSRATANKSLSGLVAEGILEFRKGIGTFVRAPVLDYDLGSLVSFTDKARAAGKVPSTRVLVFERVGCADLAESEASLLGAGSGAGAYRIERVRLADGVPVIYERRLLAGGFCAGLTRDALDGSLYSWLTEERGLSVAGADEVIRAVCLDEDDAGVLGVSRGSPALLVVATGHLASGEPLWFERTLYRADAYAFRNRLGPIRSAGPAAGVLLGSIPGQEAQRPDRIEAQRGRGLPLGVR
ncbi:MAG: GntR family transcriptional regulator [Lentisphaeria bacterium]|nr:GntR family transcriptional regulator [Lentisphaeria bacterium]